MKLWVGALVMTVWGLSFTAVDGTTQSADAALVTQLDFSSGDVNWNGNGRDGRMIERLFDQGGTLTMGSYQSMSDIVDPIMQGHKTFSLFTSGLNGATAPSTTINGSSISVDLSSLFFGVSRGDSFRAWNIGGLATGLFNPETLDFSLSWSHLLRERPFSSKAPTSFALQGRVVLAEVPVPLSAVLFMTGLIGLLFSPAVRVTMLKRFYGRVVAKG